MPYSPRVSAERLRENHPHLAAYKAPKSVIAANKLADEKLISLLDAQGLLDDAIHAIPDETIKHQLAVEQAVINNTETPYPSGIERAEAAKRIAEREVKKAEAESNNAFYAYLELLEDEAIRDEWRANLAADIAETKPLLDQKLAALQPEVEQYTEQVALTHYLGQWTEHISLPQGNVGQAFDALQRLLAAKEYATGLNITA